jgi:hypothetical protein
LSGIEVAKDRCVSLSSDTGGNDGNLAAGGCGNVEGTIAPEEVLISEDIPENSIEHCSIIAAVVQQP